MRLLLHTCCAICGAYLAEKYGVPRLRPWCPNSDGIRRSIPSFALRATDGPPNIDPRVNPWPVAEADKNDFEKITLYFYNPNIHPEEEYQKRLESVQKLAENYQLGCLAGDYHPDLWFTEVKGLESEPENGQRCPVCFAMRLTATAKKGKELGFSHFATTLGISPFKNTTLINQLGQKIGWQEKINFLPFDEAVKNDYFQKSRALAKQLTLYHQKYCGCVFSQKPPLTPP